MNNKILFRIAKVKLLVLTLISFQLSSFLVPSNTKVYAQELAYYLQNKSDAMVSAYFTHTELDNVPQPKTPKEIEEERRMIEEIARQEKYGVQGTQIDNYLKTRRSPLVGYGVKIAELSAKYGVPANLVIAISVVESNACKVNFRPFNCWGWMTRTIFTSYDQSLDAYFKYLKSTYPNLTPYGMAKKYCPPTADDWARKVSGLIAKMNF